MRALDIGCGKDAYFLGSGNNWSRAQCLDWPSLSKVIWYADNTLFLPVPMRSFTVQSSPLCCSSGLNSAGSPGIKTNPSLNSSGIKPPISVKYLEVLYHSNKGSAGAKANGTKLTAIS